MLTLPRLAIGAVQPGADTQPILWALLAALRQQGLQVQSFLSRACFARHQGEASATGLMPRHLDSWLMPPHVCRRLFVHAAIGCDLAVVEGEYAAARCPESFCGGTLDALCESLDLPRLVVLDLSRCDGGLPPRPRICDGALVDGAPCTRKPAEAAAEVERAWGVPVFATLGALPQLRAALRALPSGTRPPLELVERLAAALLRCAKLEGLVALAMRRALAWAPGPSAEDDEFLPPITVALAFDKAFDCYFPDSLDTLEAMGARLVDFSPLRDERLPDDADVVLFGCGHPERYTAELVQNHCMKLALRGFVRGGGRVYGEGGGLAYLCQELETLDGARCRMAGVFPAVARRCRPGAPPVPAELTLDQPTWLGPAGTTLRGYRNGSWWLEPAGPLAGCAAQPSRQLDVVGNYRALGSRLHLNFAAFPHLLRNFFQTRLPEPRVTDPWALV